MMTRGISPANSSRTATSCDVVEKGVWDEPLYPGKHPVNMRVMKVELVPTTNIVLNWAAARTEGAQAGCGVVHDHRAFHGRLYV